jgi:hypothetical protein
MAKIFPKSKWLFMMRDGRAVIHSVVTRKVRIYKAMISSSSRIPCEIIVPAGGAIKHTKKVAV